MNKKFTDCLQEEMKSLIFFLYLSPTGPAGQPSQANLGGSSLQAAGPGPTGGAAYTLC